MATPVTDPRVTEVLDRLEADSARAMERALRSLMRLPASVRREIDPFALLLQPRPAAAPRSDSPATPAG